MVRSTSARTLTSAWTDRARPAFALDEVDRLVAGRLAARRNDDPRARLGQGERNAAAEPASRTGDDGGPAV